MVGRTHELLVLEPDLFFELTGLHLLLCGFGVFHCDVFRGVDFLRGHRDGGRVRVEGAKAVGDLLDGDADFGAGFGVRGELLR